MDHYKLVRPEHLNDFGSLFGGILLQWIDEIAYIHVNLDYPGKQFVTVSLDDVEFKHPIRNGQILRFVCTRKREGRTSVSYHVQVIGARYQADQEKVVFENTITFVSVDAGGNKRTLSSN